MSHLYWHRGAAKIFVSTKKREVIPYLIKAIDDPCISDKAEEALVQFGANVVPFLENAIQHKGWRGRLIIFHVLRRIDTPDARKIIERVLQNENLSWNRIEAQTLRKK